MHIALFFTFGVSLKKWEMTGLLPREMLLYKHYAQDKSQVSLVTYGGKSDRVVINEEEISVFPVYERIRPSHKHYRNIIKSLSVPYKFRELMKKADIYKTNQMDGAWVAAIAKLIYRKPLLLRCGFEWYRNRCERGSPRLLKKTFVFAMSWFSYHMADAIIISNDSDAKYIAKKFRVPTDKIKVIRNYIDTDLFSPGSGNGKEANRLLYVGRLVERKNLKMVIEALSNTGYGLDLVGQGEQKEDLSRYAETHHVNIRFLGVVSNDRLPDLMREYNVFVLLSLFENNPKSLLEAMSCGLAVVASDVEGIKELITDGVNGFLCGMDRSSIRNVILKVMGDSAAQANVGRKAREFVLNECSLESVWQREMAIMGSLVRDGG
jgi:glycosyltransferase involved in cell wall biosynthesis